MNEHVIIWNGAAGSSGEPDAFEHLVHRIPHARLVTAEDAESTQREIARACADGAASIVAAGGDGTINMVVRQLMRHAQRPALGIIPLGTGNDFARNLKIPLVTEEAVVVLEQGHSRPVDAVRMTSSEGQGWYANMLTGGNTGLYMNQLTDEIKQRWGPLCYLRGVVDVMRNLEVFDVEVQCDEEPAERLQALNIFAANGPMTGAGLMVAPHARLDDGQIDLVIVKDGETLDIASLAATYVLSEFLDHDLIELRRCSKLRISSRPALPLTADGDVIGETPLEIEVVKHALRVIVPSESQPA